MRKNSIHVWLLALAALLGPLSAQAATLGIVASSPITGPLSNDGVFVTAQGDYRGYTNPGNLALGASVAVSGTIFGYSAIHNPAFLTDGNYGNGRSWIDNAPNSWLTIDLGGIETFDILTFGRDRLGSFDDRDPGQFSISVSNDNSIFTQVFDSSSLAFSGLLAFDQTVQAQFDAVSARFVKLSLGATGAAIDEVEIMHSVSAVPVPAAAWLFGTALVGLVGISRKRKIA